MSNRLKLYVCKATKSPGGKRTVYYPGLYRDVPAELAEQWMVGEPPDAWPEGEDRPSCWPPPEPPAEDEGGDEQEDTVEIIDTDY